MKWLISGSDDPIKCKAVIDARQMEFVVNEKLNEITMKIRFLSLSIPYFVLFKVQI